jgi:glycosyltransferase involved in cell wall biosynthesis
MKVSIVVPVCGMAGKESNFLFRNLKSIREQTFKDLEIVVTDNSETNNLKNVCGLFPDLDIKHSFESKKGATFNTNAGIRLSMGKIIKILHMDDFFAHPNALKEIIDNFNGGWLVTGCNHYDGEKTYNNHLARYDHKIFTGNNTIGAPSVLAIENKKPLLFDETLAWLFDCDYYTRLYDRYGMPTIIDDINVTIGIGNHQASSWLSNKLKKDEEKYMYKKYAKRI